MSADIGLIGLAVMGQNLVLNMADHGYTVAVHNRTTSKMRDFVDSPAAAGKKIIPCESLDDLVKAVKKPAPIMLMVKAGEAVDQEIDKLVPLLAAGDIVIDGGNSHFLDTIRRNKRLGEAGLRFVGTGVSGGEEGARNGPAIMPGGQREAYGRVADVFRAISAKVGGEPCCAYIGDDGAGHYVKMVHNGIEYGDMQLIAEAYFLLRRVLGMDHPELAATFDAWNAGELSSYLIEITAAILKRVDPETGRPLVEVIKDRAGQKGTGLWTSESALKLGVPAPTIAEAVFARCLSAAKDEREAAEKILPAPEAPPAPTGQLRKDLIDAVRDALYASKICSYAQGFALMREAGREYGWKLDFGEIAMIWRGGCIIRAHFLHRIRDAYAKNPELANLLLDPYFAGIIAKTQASWRLVATTAALHGIPTPAFASALAYYDGYRTGAGSANMLQAQRDYFGAHTYERTDRPGWFHTDWTA